MYRVGKTNNAMIGLRTNISKRKLPHMLTWIDESKPGNSTPGVIFCIESDVQLEILKPLIYNPKCRKNETTSINCSSCFLLFYPSIGLEP